MSITVESIKRILNPDETYFKISDNGNIGIGTSTPSALLEIHKSFTSSGIYPAGNINFSTNNTTDSWEVGGIEGYVLSNNGTFNGYPGGLAFKTKNADSDITTTSTTKMVLDANGNLGINTTSPSQKLHVVGNIYATGSITPSDKELKQILYK